MERPNYNSKLLEKTRQRNDTAAKASGWLVDEHISCIFKEVVAIASVMTENDVDLPATQNNLNAMKGELRGEMQTMKEELVKLITDLFRQMNAINERLEKIEIGLQQAETRIRSEREDIQAFYRIILPRIYPRECCPNSAQELSMLTLKEVEHLSIEKMKSDTVLNAPGGCPNAAKLAMEFFGNYHSMMRVQMIENAIMVRDGTDAPLRFTKGRVVDADTIQRGMVDANMNYYYWDKNGIWKQGQTPCSTDVGRKGQLHTVVLVYTADEHVVVVDWSNGQFMEVELKETRLYHADFTRR